MRIQSSQAENNFPKTSFKAYFVANKRFLNLWYPADKDSKTLQSIAENYKNHRLEITDAAERCYGAHGIEYRICNYTTGKTYDYFIPYTCAITHEGRLESMLWALICDPKFWNESSHYPTTSLFEAHNSLNKCTLSNFQLRDLITDECYRLPGIINNSDKNTRIQEFKNYLSETEPSKINNFLKRNYDELLTELHNKEWGWKHGKDKKALMMPLIEYVKKQAKELGVSEDKISEFDTICLKELDAPFRTNINKIITAFENILNEFDNKTSEHYISRYLPPEKKPNHNWWDDCDEDDYYC